MSRTAASLLLLATLSCLISGCAMCCGPDDENYGAYGGRWSRSDMRRGRVGSAFGPAGAEILSDTVIEVDEETTPVVPETSVLNGPPAPAPEIMSY